MMRSTRSLVLVMSVLCVATAHAGGAVNNNNFSSDYVRTLNRSAALDAADIVFYNPAGVTKLRAGWTIKADAQFADKDYANTIDPSPLLAPLGGTGHLDQSKSSLVPGIFLNWRQGSGAVFFSFTNVAGGGKVDYTQGDWTSYRASVAIRSALAALALPYDRIASHRLNAESRCMEFRVGGAWAWKQELALSAGLRYLDFTRKAEGHAELTQTGGALPPADASIGFQEHAHALAGFGGLCFTPGEKFDVGLRYDSEVSLELHQHVTASSIAVGGSPNPALGVITDAILDANEVTEGGNLHENLPGVLGLGIGYRFSERWRVEADYVWYMDSVARLDRPRFDGFGDGHDYGVTAEFRFNRSWKVSGGILLTRLDVPASSMLPERPELDATDLAGGFVWTPSRSFDVSAGFASTIYKDASFTDAAPPAGTGAEVTLSKAGFVLAGGLSFHPM